MATLAPVTYFATAQPPQGYGLYAAATNIDMGVARHLAGVDIFPYNCDTGYGTYSADMFDPNPATKAAGVRGPLQHFNPIVAYGAARCAADQTEDEELARARHLRELHEPLLVESAFATKILADAGAPAAATSFGQALGMIEEFMGEQGYTGYIHASRRFAQAASQYRWGNQTGLTRTSPLDNVWVFGGGYASVLANTLVVTGQVYTWRSTPFEQVVTTGSHSQGAFNNDVYALSERVVVAGYECVAYAVTVS